MRRRGANEKRMELRFFLSPSAAFHAFSDSRRISHCAYDWVAWREGVLVPNPRVARFPARQVHCQLHSRSWGNEPIMAKRDVTRFDGNKPVAAAEPLLSLDQMSGTSWKFATVPKPFVYAPANKCIYCGTQGEGVALTDEHIIPFSLNGCAIIPRASCGECQKIIHGYETNCTRDSFLQFRTKYKFRTRRPKERPILFPLRYGEETQPRFVPVEDHPAILVMPRFLEPGILKSARPAPGIASRLEAYADNAAIEKLKSRHAAPTLSVEGTINVNSFALMLAKIAHGFAWAILGESAFELFLPDLIRVKNLDLMSYLIGEVSSVSLPRSNEHDQFMTIVVQPCLEGHHLVFVGIKLFAAFAAPTYCAVAGRFIPSQETLDQLGLSLTGSTITKAS